VSATTDKEILEIRRNGLKKKRNPDSKRKEAMRGEREKEVRG
jgi:hypothetical protein